MKRKRRRRADRAGHQKQYILNLSSYVVLPWHVPRCQRLMYVRCLASCCPCPSILTHWLPSRPCVKSHPSTIGLHGVSMEDGLHILVTARTSSWPFSSAIPPFHIVSYRVLLSRPLHKQGARRAALGTANGDCFKPSAAPARRWQCQEPFLLSREAKGKLASSLC